MINRVALVAHRQQELPRFHVEQGLREGKEVLLDVNWLKRVPAAENKVGFFFHLVPSLDLKDNAKKFARVIMENKVRSIH